MHTMALDRKDSLTLTLPQLKIETGMVIRLVIMMLILAGVLLVGVTIYDHYKGEDISGLSSDVRLEIEISKKNLSYNSFICAFILLLFSSLIITRVTRRFKEALVSNNHELEELNHTLDHKVQQRTHSLSATLNKLEAAHTGLKNAQAQLMQAEKFSAIGQLAAGVAHEINNPIGFINSNLQTMERYAAHYAQLLSILTKLETALKDKNHTRVAEIVASWEQIRKETNFAFIGGDIGNLVKESREGTEKIRKIILDLRAFASPDRGIMDSVNLEDLMESVLNIISNEIKYKAELKKDYTQVPLVVCNPQKIYQVFVNLLINAAQSIKDRGTITIRTHIQDNQYVCVDISDTGCGIASENITKIFDPFFTTKKVGQGIGLGLSVSYDIVRKHGGTISFASKTGHGTTFTVKLPIPQRTEGDHDERN